MINEVKYNPNVEILYEGKAYIKILYDSEAYEVYGKPMGALTPDERANVRESGDKKGIRKGVSTANFFLRDTPIKPSEPAKPTRTINEETERRKAEYMEALNVKKLEEAKKMEAIQQQHNLKRQAQQLKLKLERGDIPPGQERADALKLYFDLNNEWNENARKR
jgi:hypothetical protein